MRYSSSVRTAVLVGTVLLAACSDQVPTAIEEQDGQSAVSSGPQLVECPVSVSRSVTGTLGLPGGTLELDGHSLVVPFGALALPVEFTLTAPPSRYIELHITANGAHGFEFLAAAAITISYDSCSRNNITPSPLTVYKIDPASKALWKNMGGTDDKIARRVTFSTDSLSAYSIAQ